MAVVYHVTMSLDGFVAGRDDDMSWMFGRTYAPNAAVDAALNRIGAIVIGHRTYYGGDGATGAITDEGKPYGGAISVPTFVLTRDDPAAALPGYTFLDAPIAEALSTAVAAAGAGDVAILGATTARRCLDAGRLDEILIHLVPVLLGDGVRLFDRPGGEPIELEWIERSDAGDVVNLRARVAQ